MKNTLRYHDEWRGYRAKVRAARDKYVRELRRLEPYMDSKEGGRDAEAAKATFEDALKAARADASPRFARIIADMKEHIAAPDMKPPSPEMLAVLQAMDMRDDIEADEIEAAARAMKNNDLALRTLRDVLQRKGRTLPPNVTTFEAQQRNAVDALQRAASKLLAWDGRTRREVLNDYFKARNDFKFAGGEPPAANAHASSDVADMEAAGTYRATVQNVIGDGVSMDVVDALG